MAQMNFVPGQGLEKTNQGIPTPLLLTTNLGKEGLGYPQNQLGKGKKPRRHWAPKGSKLQFKPSSKVITRESTICMTETSHPTFSWDQAIKKSPPIEPATTFTPIDPTAAWVQQITRSGRVYQPPPVVAEKGTPVVELKEYRA